MAKRLLFLGFLIVVCVIVFSCGYSEKDAQRYLPGTYTYEIPTGEVQVLKINPDFTFNQIVYSKNKKVILSKNIGKMYVDDNKIKLEHWLECYEDAEQKILSKPYITNSSGNYWRKPKGNENVLIILFDQTNYIFRKN